MVKLLITLWAERDAVLMHIHLILAAMFPIYIGSHASLRRPPSAAAPMKSKTEDEDDDEIVVEPTVEVLTPSDAIMFPVLAGITLGGLYLLIKWLKDPALLNKILGWYFSALGVFGVGKLAADALKVGTTFIFPEVWSSKMRTYYFETLFLRQAAGWISRDQILVQGKIVDGITNPFPGRFLSNIKFSESMTKRIWAFRSLLKNHWIFRGYLHNVFSVTSKVQIQDITGFMFGIAAIALYNTWGKVWFLTNLIGFGFCYGTLQLMSPTTFWTGSLVLGGLFIYDITMVFYTPLMVTVATTLDVPIKLVFPGTVGKRGSMLGLVCFDFFPALKH
jgi:minor histocompatibility antigen H13